MNNIRKLWSELSGQSECVGVTWEYWIMFICLSLLWFSPENSEGLSFLLRKFLLSFRLYIRSTYRTKCDGPVNHGSCGCYEMHTIIKVGVVRTHFLFRIINVKVEGWVPPTVVVVWPLCNNMTIFDNDNWTFSCI